MDNFCNCMCGDISRNHQCSEHWPLKLAIDICTCHIKYIQSKKFDDVIRRDIRREVARGLWGGEEAICAGRRSGLWRVCFAAAADNQSSQVNPSPNKMGQECGEEAIAACKSRIATWTTAAAAAAAADTTTARASTHLLRMFLARICWGLLGNQHALQ